MIADLGTIGGRVIATGGGASLLPSNRRHLSQYGFVVLLELERNEIVQRMQASDDRPPLTSHDMADEVDELLRTRRPHYHALADHVIDACRPVPELVSEIIASHAAWSAQEQGKGEHGL